MDDESVPSVLSRVKFWLLLALSIPSTICSLLIFLYFYNRRKRLSIQLHVILLLVVVSFIQITTDNPFGIAYYYHEQVPITSNIFCLWWNWWDYSTSGMLIMIMAWGSVERHVLVFRNTMMSNRRKRRLFHLLPMLIVSIYPLIFYFAVIFLNSCENAWDFTMVSCLSIFENKNCLQSVLVVLYSTMLFG